MKQITKITLGLLIALTIFVWSTVVRSPASNNGCGLYFLNVGQGDAELIQKGDYQILIDGGPDDSILSEIGKVMPLTDRKIETIILTHPHADHLVGLNQIIDRYEIGTIYATGVVHTSNAYLEFLEKTKSKNITMEVPDIGEKLTPFDNGNLEFLWPGKVYAEKSAEENNLNDTSLVGRFCYFNHCALLTGDLETDGQEEMFNFYSSKQSEASVEKSGDNVFQSEILKIAHHGSTNGTNQRILDFVKPKYAVIEVGADNKFGHPHAGTLDLLQKANIRFYRTDQNGTIEINISEEGITKK
ncbi:MAG: MBL fold metallo-hydrolase [Patescibacteria group bacterium]|jgi:competence protein ComEC